MGLGLIRTRLSHDNCVSFRSNFKTPKNCQGGEGGSSNIFYIGILIFQNPTTNPFWDFSNGGKKKKKERKIPKIVAYLSCSADRTHFARTNFPTLHWFIVQ